MFIHLDSGARLPMFKIIHHYLTALQRWESPLYFLGLSFLIFKIMIIVITRS